MKKLNVIATILCLAVLAIGCESTGDYAEEAAPNEGDMAFEKNSKTVLAELAAWQNENVDYNNFYASDYEAWGTGFGEPDTVTLAQRIEADKQMFAMFDFKIANEPVNLLPGVNVETKKMDGSVRLYAEWEVTLTATDSTEAKSGNLRMYHVYVFNEEGKINLTLTYGDFGGLMSYLHSEE